MSRTPSEKQRGERVRSSAVGHKSPYVDSVTTALSRHIEVLLALQARHTDGHTYQGWAEFRYAGREQWVAEQISRAWLLEWASARSRIKVTNAVPD